MTKSLLCKENPRTDGRPSPTTAEFNRYVITFTKTPDTLHALPEVQKRFPEAVLIPVPHQISRSCGLAIELPVWQPDEQCSMFRELTVPAYLYRMTMCCSDQGSCRIVDAWLEDEKGAYGVGDTTRSAI